MLIRLSSLLFSAFILTNCQGPTNTPVQDEILRAADNMEAAGDLKSAIALYESAIPKLNSQSKLDVYLKLGKALLATGDLERARAVFKEALQYDDESRAKKQLARTYVLAGKTEIAYPIYEQIEKDRPNDPDAHNGLGILLDMRGDHAAAQQHYRVALLQKPDDIGIKENLGLSLAFSGDTSEAILILEPLGTCSEAKQQQRHNLAVAYALAGNHARAREIFSRDLNDAEVEENLHNLSRAATKQERIQEPSAKKMSIEKMLASLPKNAPHAASKEHVVSKEKVKKKEHIKPKAKAKKSKPKCSKKKESKHKRKEASKSETKSHDHSKEAKNDTKPVEDKAKSEAKADVKKEEVKAESKIETKPEEKKEEVKLDSKGEKKE